MRYLPNQHTWPRFATMIVVCACALYGTWWKTHPHTVVTERTRTVTHVQQVKQGDGLLTEVQCRAIGRGTKIDDLRAKYGVPKGDDDLAYAWEYPIRGDEKRLCTVSYHDWYGPFRKGNRVDSVNLDLVAP